MEKKSSGYQTGIASEHLVLSMLYRLGAKAYLTLGNEKSIDIRITKDDGSWISVDVKSVRKGNAIPVGNAVDKDNHYYVFVIYNNKFSDYLFILIFILFLAILLLREERNLMVVLLIYSRKIL